MRIKETKIENNPSPRQRRLLIVAALICPTSTDQIFLGGGFKH